MASRSKINKHPTPQDHPLPEEILAQLTETISSLCSPHPGHNVSLRAKEIKNSNAAKNASGKGPGYTFSHAYCDMADHRKSFVFGDVFRKGLDIGIGFLRGEIPVERPEEILLEKLATCLKLGEGLDIECIESEADVTAVLANHLFGKLSLSPCFTIDRTSNRKEQGNRCACGDECCLLTGAYGDTSIGNQHVWHGSVDIILDNSIVVETIEEEEADDPGGRSSVDVNAQLAAESIVFSFLQQKRHPERSHFLTPCIGIGRKSLVVTLYDPQHDVLLQTPEIALMSESCTQKFSVQAIFLIWLAVNYKFLCTGLTVDMLPYKAQFLTKAKDSLNVYKHDLQMHNIKPCDKLQEPVLEVEYNEFLTEKYKQVNDIAIQRLLSSRIKNEDGQMSNSKDGGS